MLIITVSIDPGRMAGFCLVDILPLSFLCQTWEGLEYPEAVITVDSAWLCIFENWLEIYNLVLRWCRYSWGSPITLHAVVGLLVLDQDVCSCSSAWCVQTTFLTNICSLVSGYSFCSICRDFAACRSGKVEWVLLWMMTNYLCKFLFCFSNYSPFPPNS